MFFELPHLTIFYDSPAFTLSNMLFSVARFIIGIVQAGKENYVKPTFKYTRNFQCHDVSGREACQSSKRPKI